MNTPDDATDAQINALFDREAGAKTVVVEQHYGRRHDDVDLLKVLGSILVLALVVAIGVIVL
jgi:hypothetical protein